MTTQTKKQFSPQKEIWVVDDNIDHSDLIIETIEEISSDFNLVHLESGETALQQLIKRSSISAPLPDLIFMDIKMPRMNGIETLTAIKNNRAYKGIPVVMLSTSTNELEIKQCLCAGAILYLSKPLTSQYFLTNILPLINLESE